MTTSITRRSLLAALGAATVGALAPWPAAAGTLLSAARRSATRRAATVAASKTATSPAKPHDVVVSRSRHPQAAAHIDAAQRQGQPSVLHLDRGGASRRRAASTGSVSLSRKPGPLYERDEYPPAFVREGGVNANVRYIHRHDNRGAGSTMRAQTQHLPDGARIRIVVSD